MGKFKLYNVDLKNLSPGVHEFEYLLENKFFVDIDGTEVQKGKVKVHLTVKRSSMMFEMNFQIEGVVVVPCDRCLDDMEIPIDTHNRLVVKFGKEYAEESDEVVVIPEEEGAINLAWFLYEFIALAVPMKHVHAPGKCNKAMSSKLKKHTARSSDETEDDFEDDMGGDDLALEDDGKEDGRGWMENLLAAVRDQIPALREGSTAENTLSAGTEAAETDTAKQDSFPGPGAERGQTESKEQGTEEDGG